MLVRTVFFIAAGLAFVFAVAFYTVLDPGKPSNRDFKRAGSQSAAETILKTWRKHGQEEIAKKNLAVDWLFIVIYSTMWISGALYLGPRADPKLHFPLLIVAAVGIAGALCDVVENVCLYLMLHGNTTTWAPGLCSAVSPINVALFFIALLGFVAAGIAIKFT